MIIVKQKRKLTIELTMAAIEALILGIPLFIWGDSIAKLLFLITFIILYGIICIALFLFPLISTPKRVEISSQSMKFHYVIREEQSRPLNLLSLSMEEQVVDDKKSHLISYKIKDPFPKLTNRKGYIIGGKIIKEKIPNMLGKSVIRINQRNTSLNTQELDTAILTLSHWINASRAE
jgi:hypothetical protein